MAFVLFTYIYWHYTSALIALMINIRNILTFLWRFFAIPTLLKTLFSPWHRMQESYQKGFNIQDVASTFIVNTLMRLVGAIARLAVISFGAGVLIAAATLSLVAVLLWIMFPAVVGLLIVFIVDLFV